MPEPMFLEKVHGLHAERLHQEAGFHAGEMIKDGIIGDVVQVLIMAPHRFSKDKCPEF